MRDYYAWLHGAVNDFRKPLSKDEYRAVGMVAVLGALFGATIGFLAVPRWDVALICAVLSIPGGLFAGALAVPLLRRQRAAKRPLWVTLGLALCFALVTGVYCTAHSTLIRIIIVGVAGVAFAVMGFVLTEPAKRPTVLRLISGLAIGMALVVGVEYTKPSTWISTIVIIIVAVAYFAIARHVYRKKSEPDSTEPGRR